MKRRKFVQAGTLAGLGLGFSGIYACSSPTRQQETSSDTEGPEKSFEPFFKLSLAQWSIHRKIEDEGFDPYLFHQKAKELGFEGVEFVSQLYLPKEEGMGGEGFNTKMDFMVQQLNEQSSSTGLKNLIMMTDLEEDTGDLAWKDKAKRDRAIEVHYPWIDATAALGCHSIRINMFGEKDPDEWKSSAIVALGALGEYASAKNVNVIIENHGWLSSNAALLMEVINEVGMANCGTLPDFGNFCVKRPDDSRWDGCIEEYDRYKGVEEMMPNAFAVSAKSNDFDAEGNETKTDYKRMLQIVKDAGYSGFIGVEYEGDILSEEDGIKATKDLLLRAAKEIS